MELEQDNVQSGSVLRKLIESVPGLAVLRVKELGSEAAAIGAFADIWQGALLDPSPGQPPSVALKMLRMEGTNARDVNTRIYKRLARELSVWSRLHHENVLPLLGISADWESRSNRLAIVLPWAENGNLRDYISRNPDFDLHSMLYGIAQGISYLHSLDIVHGDLKCDNVLVDAKGVPRLTDFGLSIIIDEETETSKTLVAGNPRWTAPECIDPQHFHLTTTTMRSKASDMYSLGMTIYEMGSSMIPFNDIDKLSVFRAVVSGKRPSYPGEIAYNRGLTQPLWSFVEQCWSEDRDKRPDISRLLELLAISDTTSHSDISSGSEWPSLTEDSSPPSTSAGLRRRYAGFGSFATSDIPASSIRLQSHTPHSRSASWYVYKGSYRSGGASQEVAVKRYLIEMDDTDRVRRQLYREAKVWSMLHHTNVLPLLGVWEEPRSQQPCLVSPWMPNGNLREYLPLRPTIDFTGMMAGIVHGLSYLHNQGIVHGNLTPESILIDVNGVPKLTDFGLSRLLQDMPHLSTTSAYSGTIRWMAPERLHPEAFGLSSMASLSPASDVFSLGLVLYQIVSLREPFAELSQTFAVMQAITKGRRPSPPGEDARVRGLTPALWDMIQRCLNQNPSNRPQAAELLSAIFPPRHVIRAAGARDDSPDSRSYDPQELMSRCHQMSAELVRLFQASSGKCEEGDPVRACIDAVRSAVNNNEGRTVNVRGLNEELDIAMQTYMGVLLRDVERWSSSMVRAALEEQESVAALERLLSMQDRSTVLRILTLVKTTYEELDASETRSSPSYELFNGLRSLLTKDTIPPSVHLTQLSIDAEPRIANNQSDLYFGRLTNGSAERMVAVKRLRPVFPRQERINALLCEGAVWRLLRHPNVVRFYGIHHDLELVMQWADNGDIMRYMKANPECNRRALVRQAALGLEYLHRYDIVHGDIRGCKILINGAGVPIWGGFGLAQWFAITDDNPMAHASSASTATTIVRWMAPERVLDTHPTPTTASDIFSFGRTILEVMTGDKPFREIKNALQIVWLLSGQRLPLVMPTDPAVVERGLTEELWALLREMWETDPGRRPNITTVVARLHELT